MNTNQFIPKSYTNFIENGSISAQSPSNIALVKYWGKYGEQLPQNASVSFTRYRNVEQKPRCILKKFLLRRIFQL